MKILVSTIVCSLLITMSSLAQSPLADTIPQLKEWWRADGMQYAKYGMTWLDNFYQGKGALVVWTPQGVKTWLLRFPGDTMNVFTWEKGSANIKTGDFNGDGITDYVDENSNIYEGVKNGEPPKQATQTPAKGFFPWIVTDINGDGKDDMIKPGLPGSVLFGKSNLSEIINEKLILPGLDSNNEAIVAYMVSPKEMRIVCGHRYWTNSVNYPFRNIYKDGLRLVRAWWDGTGFKSEVLDEFTVNLSNGQGGYNGGALLKQSDSKIYWIGSSDGNKLTIYNLAGNKLEKLYGMEYNGGVIGTLKHSIDSNSSSDFYIWTLKNDICNIVFYSGDIDSTLRPINQFTTVQMITLISLPVLTNDGKPGLALSHKYRFSLLIPKDTATSTLEESEESTAFSLHVLPPMPIRREQPIQMKITAPKLGNYSIFLYDSVGKKILSKMIHIQNIGENFISRTYAVHSFV